MGCRLSLFTANWTQITSDPWVLETILGYKLEFLGCPTNAKALSQAVLDLASKGAITPTQPDFPGGQVRRVMAPSDQSQILKLVDCTSPLQDGVHQDSEGATDAGR